MVARHGYGGANDIVVAACGSDDVIGSEAEPLANHLRCSDRVKIHEMCCLISIHRIRPGPAT